MKFRRLLKKNVHFEYHNIANKTPPLLYENRVFDLILLKNILIYFDKEKAKEVVDFLYTNIKTGRWLSTTPVEYSSDIFNSYQAKNFSEESMILKSAVPDIKSLSQLPLLQTDDNIDSYLDIVKIFQPYKQSVQDEKICKILESSIENKFFNNEPFKHYQKACELLETGEVQEAKKHLRKCLYVDNNFLVGLISFGNIFKKEDDNENFSRYINRAKELLYKMEPHTIVDFSDGMTVEELLGMINHEKISDEGVVNANS
jgi:tetratricopeptide (TPR) repeat protein